MCNYFGRKIKQTISLYFDQWNCFFSYFYKCICLRRERNVIRQTIRYLKKLANFFYFENLIFKVCSHILIKPVWFFYIKNYFVQD